MANRSFTYVVHIQSTPEKVWEALTSGDFTEQYWGGRRITSDWQVGSSVQHIQPSGDLDWRGEVIKADAPSELVYTFDTGDEPPSRVTFRLMPQGPNVRLMLLHEEVDTDEQGYQMGAEGWAAILSSLKTLLETGEPLTFPQWGG